MHETNRQFSEVLSADLLINRSTNSLWCAGCGARCPSPDVDGGWTRELGGATAQGAGPLRGTRVLCPHLRQERGRLQRPARERGALQGCQATRYTTKNGLDK